MVKKTSRKTLQQEAELMDRMLSKSRLTEEDAERIGHEIKHEIAKRLFKKQARKRDSGIQNSNK